jgi:hypothetical protein
MALGPDVQRLDTCGTEVSRPALKTPEADDSSKTLFVPQ